MTAMSPLLQRLDRQLCGHCGGALGVALTDEAVVHITALDGTSSDCKMSVVMMLFQALQLSCGPCQI